MFGRVWRIVLICSRQLTVRSASFITIEIDTLEKQQTEKIETKMKDVNRIRIRKVYASCPGWPSGGSKEFSSQTQIYAIPCRLQLPTYKWRSAGPGRSLYLLSITGLAALGGQYHSLTGTEFSASKWVTCLLPATQAGSHAGSKVYIWNVFVFADFFSDLV